MRSNALLIFCILILCTSIISCVEEEDFTCDAFNEDIDIESVKRQAIIKFDDSLLGLIEDDLRKGKARTRSTDVNDVMDTLGIISMKRLFPFAGKYEARTRNAGLHKWYKVEYKADIPQTKALEIFEAVVGIEFVETFRPIKPMGVFDDPMLDLQWNYVNKGNLTEMHLSGYDVNVVQAWEDGFVGDENVIVAVIDGGIDQNHEDLAANCLGGFNFVRNNNEIIPHEHGTHVAGIIAAVNNNGIGICGLAGGDVKGGVNGVKMLSCQIFENDFASGQEFSADGAAAIKWAADHGAVIAQNSWGYLFETYRQAKNTRIDRTLKEAIDYFVEYAGIDEYGHQIGPMKGGIVFFAAGNDGWDTDPIGKYDPVISVGAATSYGSRAYYSNYGDWVDISAPGGSFEYDECMILSTLPNNKYGYMAGTSMACPHVSGAAALILSKYGCPGYTPEDLRHRLLEEADFSAISEDEQVGPMLDIVGALSDLPDITPVPVKIISASSGMNSIEIQWNVRQNVDGILPSYYKAFLSDRKGVLDTMKDMNSIPLDVTVSKVGTEYKKDGDVIICRFDGLKSDTSYEVGVVAFNKKGVCSEMSDIISVSTQPNNAPHIELISETEFPIRVGAHDVVSVAYYVSDEDNQAVSLYLKGDNIGLSYEYMNSEGILNIKIKGDGFNHGVFSTEIILTDSCGATRTTSFEYELIENKIPVLLKNHSDIFMLNDGVPVFLELNEYFKDLDSGELTYDINVSDTNVLGYNLIDDRLMFYPNDVGFSSVNIRSNDSYAYSENLKFNVLVKNKDIPVVVYPNPISDFMNVSVSFEDSVHLTIGSVTGEILYDEFVYLNPLDDTKIDLRYLQPGKYKLMIKGSKLSLSKLIIKL